MPGLRRDAAKQFRVDTINPPLYLYFISTSKLTPPNKTAYELLPTPEAGGAPNRSCDCARVLRAGSCRFLEISRNAQANSWAVTCCSLPIQIASLTGRANALPHRLRLRQARVTAHGICHSYRRIRFGKDYDSQSSFRSLRRASRSLSF